MELSKDLIQEFASVTDDRPDVLPETTCYGTARFVEGADYVVIDGADVRTPAIFTVKALDGDRVMVMLKARKAVVIANISNPTLMVGTLIANTGIVVNGYLTTNEARTVYNDSSHAGLTFSNGGIGAYSTLGSWWLKNDGTFQLGGSNGITFSDSKVRFGSNVVLSWDNLPDDVANNDDIPQNLDDLSDGSTYKHWNTEIGKNWIQTANITCQNLKVANAASMGTGVNSIKYNANTGKIEFGSGVTMSWSSVSSKPTIPTDVNQLTDASGQKWSTSVGATWIQTADVTCQNLKVANATSIGSGVNSIKYNSTSGKIEFGSGVTMSWSSVSSKPTIPTDVNQLTDASGQKWSTSVGNTWIKTATVTCQNLTVANAIAMGTGANSIKYNSTSGKIEFGANVKLSWSNLSDVPAGQEIPTDISDLTDNSNKLWTTEIAGNWIKTAQVTCQNLTVANAIAMGTGANSIKYNSTSGKIEFGANVQLSWSSGISGKPTIPTDVNQLADASGQKWSTSVGATWIKTSELEAQNLTIKGGGIYLGTASNNVYPFQVTNAGVMTCSGATVKGAIYAYSGQFGASNATNKITIGTNATHASIYYGMSSLGSTTATGFYIGTDGIALGGGKFKVTSAGAATVKGNIYAYSGQFGAENATNKITIGTNATHASIYYGMSSLGSTTATGFYIGTDGIALGGGKFKVTNAGVATVNGSVTATSLVATNCITLNAGGATYTVNGVSYPSPTANTKLTMAFTTGSDYDDYSSPYFPNYVAPSGTVPIVKLSRGIILNGNIVATEAYATNVVSSTVSTCTISAHQGQRIASYSGNSGSAGYIWLCTLKITKTYVDHPMEIRYIARSRKAVETITIRFYGANNKDPNLDLFTYFCNGQDSTSNAYIKKRTTSQWDIYIQKNSAYGIVTPISVAKAVDSPDILWVGEQVDTADFPSGTTQATKVG